VSVLFLIQGPPEVASSRTRAFAYLPYLSAMNISTEAFVWNSAQFVARQRHGAVPLVAHLVNAMRRVSVAIRVWIAASRHQAIYVQKVILPSWFLRSLKRRGRRLVFDYDDAMYAMAPEQDKGPRSWIRRRRVARFTACLAAADLVVIENEPNRAVAERYCQRTLTITGPIDTDRYRPVARQRRPEIVIGWIGSPSTTSYLRLIEPALRELAARHAVALHLIGAAPFEIPGVTVRHFPWSLESEVADLGTFDVGMMPLTDDAWARGKGGYKLLQYMAMGIPSVASPVGINGELIRHGRTGLLARTPDEWIAALERLIESFDDREKMGRQAREDAVARFSLTHYAPQFIDALLPAAEPAKARSFRIEGLQP
jgi:glycosyltransferase involved in cell wall biosynthesis